MSREMIGCWISYKDFKPYKIGRQDGRKVFMVGLTDKNLRTSLECKELGSRFAFALLPERTISRWEKGEAKKLLESLNWNGSDLIKRANQDKKQPKKEAEIIGRVYF